MGVYQISRAVLKLSGESLRGHGEYGLDWSVLDYLAKEIQIAVKQKVEINQLKFSEERVQSN